MPVHGEAMQTLAAVDRKGIARLSAREREVLSYASWGYMDKQISAELGVSANTLRTYWTRIRTKVGDASRSALAVAYVESIQTDTPEDEEPFDWEIDVDKHLFRKLSDKYTPLDIRVGEERSMDLVMNAVHPADSPRVQSMFALITSGEMDSITYAFRLITVRGVEIASATASAVRDKSGKVVMIRGRRLPNVDLREPTVASLKIGHWERDLLGSNFSADRGFGEIFRVDIHSATLREDVFNRFPPEESDNTRTFVTRTIEAGLDENRSTHKLQFEDGSQLWITTHLRIQYEDGVAVKALGTVTAFI